MLNKGELTRKELFVRVTFFNSVIDNFYKSEIMELVSRWEIALNQITLIN